MDIRSGAWVGEQLALPAEQRAREEQTGKEVTLVSQTAPNGRHLMHLQAALNHPDAVLIQDGLSPHRWLAEAMGKAWATGQVPVSYSSRG